MIIRKTAAEIDKIAKAGEILVSTMRLIERELRPGISTVELDRIAEHHIRSHGAIPTFKGFEGFPGSICASPNDMVVHGIPGAYKLSRGDILSVDIGVTYEGWVADAAQTFPIGKISLAAEHLLSCTKQSLFNAVKQCEIGNRIGDISNAVQTTVEGEGLSIIRSLVGHGVGQDMHEDPQIPNYGPAGRGVRLEEGMVLAIEPMVTVGAPEVHVGSDNWSIFSDDKSLAAHFEFTVAITAAGPKVMTPWHKPIV